MATFKYGTPSGEELCKVTKVNLIEEDGKYYLSIEYEIEDEFRRTKYTVPRINLDIDFKHNLPEIDNCASTYPYGRDVYRFKCGNHFYLIEPVKEYDGLGEYEYSFKREVVKEKSRKLTISEIEKKLGYKIEIVAEKEDKK